MEAQSKQFWLSYDFGIDGNYNQLFQWLDSVKAVECGDSVASFQLNLNFKSSDDIPKTALKKIKEHVQLRKQDRLYLIWRDGSKVRGEFIHGQRHRSPWAGYAVEGPEGEEDAA